ncbi:MAG: hypothetical protein K6U89_19415 [Chloroflexi bacterium]|nr:hypothetical protein [Chloroflexota bacterium]
MSPEKRVMEWLTGGTPVLYLLVCFTALLGAVYWLSNSGRFTRPAQATPSGQLGQRGSAGASFLGAVTRLQPHAGQPIWIARDGRAYNLFWQAQAAGDARHAEALLHSGAVFPVEDDTEARVIGEGRGCYRVRLLEGERQGQEGWAPAANLASLAAHRGL